MIVNSNNNDNECFRWAVIALERVGMKDPPRISILRSFEGNYNWSRLEFLVSVKDIGIFERNNEISVNVMAIEDRDIYICRKGTRSYE